MKQKCFNNYLFKSINEKQNSTIVIENFEWKNLVDDTKLGRILAHVVFGSTFKILQQSS